MTFAQKTFAPKRFAQKLLSREVVTVLAIAALGLGLRLYGLGDAWLNPDEGIYYSMTAWRDADRFWEEVPGNAHPPLYYLMLRAIASFTSDFVALRLLSVFSGVASIFAIYALSRALLSSHESPAQQSIAALSAALVVAVAPGHVMLSQILRPYAFLIAMLCFGMAGLVSWLRGGRSSALALYVVATSLALLTHYSALLVAPAMAAVLVLAVLRGDLRGRRLWQTAAVQVVPIGIVAALYFLHLRPRLIGSALADQALAESGWLTPFLIDSGFDVWTHTKGFLSFLFGQSFEVLALLLSIVGFAALAWRREVQALVLLATLWGTAVGLAALGKYPFGACRHATWVLPVFVVAAARAVSAVTLAIGWRRERGFVLAGLAALALGLCWYAGPEFARYTNGGVPHQEIAAEKAVPRASIARFAAVQSEIEGEATFVLTDMQSYYTLLPLYRRSREAATVAADITWLRFPWGNAEVVVAWRWMLSPLPQDYGTPAHILELMRVRDAAVADGPRLAKSATCYLLWAGWPAGGPIALAQTNAALPTEKRFIDRAFSVPGVTAYRVDLPKLVAALRR